MTGNAISLWLVSAGFLAALLAVIEIGYACGRRTRERLSDVELENSWLTGLIAALLAVLGLLLGFSVNMAVDRFEARRHLVVDEANAIGSFFLRAELVPPPDGAEINHLLHDYVELRLQFAAARDSAGIVTARTRAAKLQAQLWSRAAAFAQNDPRSVPAALLLQSLNDAFDMEASRWAAFNANVPAPVIRVDIFVAMVGVMLVGYNLGLAGRRHFFAWSMFCLCIALVLGVILDLEQPMQGVIRESQEPMIELLHHMDSQ